MTTCAELTPVDSVTGETEGPEMTVGELTEVLLPPLQSCPEPLAATLAPPAGEAVEPWETAARLVGLSIGAAGAADGVTLEVVGEHLQVRAIDAAGHEKALLVPRPHTSMERQEAAALGRSLLRPLDAPVANPLLAALEERRAKTVSVDPSQPPAMPATSSGSPAWT